MPPSSWILVPIFTHASLSGPSYLLPCKISPKSDYLQLSYCDLFNSSAVSFCINIPNMVQMLWCFAQISIKNEITLATADSKFSAGNGGTIAQLQIVWCRWNFVPRVSLEGHCLGAPSCLSSCKIQNWKPSFLSKFPTNHMSISLSFRDVCMRHRWTARQHRQLL